MVKRISYPTVDKEAVLRMKLEWKKMKEIITELSIRNETFYRFSQAVVKQYSYGKWKQKYLKN